MGVASKLMKDEAAIDDPICPVVSDTDTADIGKEEIKITSELLNNETEKGRIDNSEIKKKSSKSCHKNILNKALENMNSKDYGFSMKSEKKKYRSINSKDDLSFLDTKASSSNQCREIFFGN